MSTRKKRVIKLPSRTKKQQEETSLPRRPARGETQVATQELDKVDERMAEILGERQTHEVISNERLWEENRQRGGE